MNVNNMMLKRFHTLLGVLSLFALQTAIPVQAQEFGIIDNVETLSSPQGPQIHITFLRSAQYIGHTPKEESQQLFIDLRLVGTWQNEPQVPPAQQLRLRPTAELPLQLVSYIERGGSDARLELNFTRAVRYSVSADRDFRGITVTLTKSPAPAEESAVQGTPQDEARAESMMQQARKLMVDERNFAAAVSLYQQVLDLPANSRSREALELLGLARERLGQRAQAKAVYEGYLQRYPQGESSERVRQRLMSLITATLPEQQKLREAKKRQQDGKWQTYGAFSQYYLQTSVQIDNNPSETTIEALSTDLDVIAQRRSADSQSRFRLTAGHYHDMLPDSSGDTTRISALYAEHQDRDDGWWLRGGRQSGNHDGTLGRFDGVKLGYNLAKRVEATLVAGYPVASSRDQLDTERRFSGVALDLGPFAEHWEFTLYGIKQEVNVLTDREAVGGELRYFRPELTVMGLADYDTFYDELNIGMLLANWTLPSELTINTTLDVRKSPLLTTSNALQGQAVENIDQLRALYSDEVIYELARDRTTETRSATLGLSMPLNTQLRLTGDLSAMQTTASVASGGVPATPATDTEYFFNLQLIGTGVLNGDDISAIGMRYSDTTTATATGLYASTRLPVGDHWRFYPRLRIDQRNWKADSQSQWLLSPIIGAEYRWDKMHLEAELGGEWISHKLPDDTEDSASYFGRIGYRYEF